MRTNYVLIDYENVQPSSLRELDKTHFEVFVFLGEKQEKIRRSVATELQKMGERGNYIEISGVGRNALDFHIAYYIGKLSATEKDAYFHIISKDTGFDPLIKHLRTQKISACRSEDVSEIPIVKAAASGSPADRLESVIAKLCRLGAPRPRKVKTLSGTIKTWFQGALTDPEVEVLCKGLEKRGIIQVTDNKVVYTSLAKPDATQVL